MDNSEFEKETDSLVSINTNDRIEFALDIPFVPHTADVACGLYVDITLNSAPIAPALLILATDCSGSMSGKPLEQVKQALEVALEEKSPNLTTRVILFNNKALLFRGTTEDVAKLKAASTTSFSAAFTKTQEEIEEFVYENRDAPKLNVVIVFLSDGEDTCGGAASYNPIVERLHKYLDYQKAKMVSTVHTIAFSAESDFETLLRFKDIGSQQGTFQFCELHDGRTLLREKMLNALSTVVSLHGELTLSGPISLDPDCNFNITTNIDLFVEKKSITCTIQKLVSLSVDTMKLDVTKPIQYVLKLDNGFVVKGETILTVNRLNPTETEALFTLRTLNKEIDELLTALTSAKNVDKVYIDKCSAELKLLSERTKCFQQADVFKIAKKRRDEIFLKRKEFYTKFNAMTAMIAKGEWTSQTKARIADVHYLNNFPEGRQRRINSRIIRNSHVLIEDEQKLERVNVKDIKSSDESDLLFTCIITYCSWKELAQSKDIIGFGLNVFRPEFIVEDPTTLTVHGISLSFISWNSMVDAIKNAIVIKGQDSALGVFGGEVGTTLKDEAAMQVNAWLPLYINHRHWDLVRVLSHQILGFFVVLDPLAYTRKQVEALFLVLSKMVGFQARTTSDKGLAMLAAFHRTCYEYSSMLDYGSFAVKIIERIITVSPFYPLEKFKCIPVLATFPLLLNRDQFMKVFDSREKWERFWVNLLTLILKHAIFLRGDALRASNKSKNISRFVFYDFVNSVFGDEVQLEKDEKSANSSGPTEHPQFVNLHYSRLFNKETDTPFSIEQYLELVEDKLSCELGSKFASDFFAQNENYGFPTIRNLLIILKYVNFWVHENFFLKDEKTLSFFDSLDASFGVLTNECSTRLRKQLSAEHFNIDAYFDEIMSNNIPFANPEPTYRLASKEYRSFLVRAMISSSALFNVASQAKEYIDNRGGFLQPYENPLKTIKEVALVGVKLIGSKTQNMKVNHNWNQKLTSLESFSSSTGFINTIEASKYSDGSRFSYNFKLTFHRLFLGDISQNDYNTKLNWLGAVISGQLIMKPDDKPDEKAESSSNSSALISPSSYVYQLFPTVWMPGRRYMRKLSNAFSTDVQSFLVTYIDQCQKM